MTAALGQAHVELFRRSRQVAKILRIEGWHGVETRLRAAVANWVAPQERGMPVRAADILAADLARPFAAPVPPATPGQPLRINWVSTPPAPGSGGHTTLFRIIKYLEARGHVNRLYFYDVYNGDEEYYRQIVRRYYGFHGPVAAIDDGMEDAHAVFATAWPTAYAVFNARCAGKRFYFVQDYEPSFHPVSVESILAENTYRMHFHAITAGRWLAEKLRADYGMSADHFDFGCDVDRYGLLPGEPRSGVAFYARPSTARRGFELGALALELFAQRRPDLEIHLYGDKIGRLPFSCIDHGSVSPDALNRIYNRCFAGLSLSLTNVSLVPHEMLAAGCVPIVNDAAHNRIVLDNPLVCYATPTPHALCEKLESVVSSTNFEALSRAAAASVRSSTWNDAAAKVDAILRRVALKDAGQPAQQTLAPTSQASA